MLQTHILLNETQKHHSQTTVKSETPTTKMAAAKVALVTGGNSGIGYEIVKALLQSTKPYHVLLGSRSLEKGQGAVESVRKECPNSSSTVELLEVDLVSDSS